MSLCGTAADHCCWMRGVICPYVINSDQPGFNWACSLRKREGSWAAAYQTPEYKTYVRPALDRAGIEQDCGDWPPKGRRCNTCGQEG